MPEHRRFQRVYIYKTPPTRELHAKVQDFLSDSLRIVCARRPLEGVAVCHVCRGRRRFIHLRSDFSHTLCRHSTTCSNGAIGSTARKFVDATADASDVYKGQRADVIRHGEGFGIRVVTWRKRGHG